MIDITGDLHRKELAFKIKDLVTDERLYTVITEIDHFEISPLPLGMMMGWRYGADCRISDLLKQHESKEVKNLRFRLKTTWVIIFVCLVRIVTYWLNQ